MKLIKLTPLLLLMLLACTSTVWGQEEEEAEGAVEGAIYIPMEPPFVVNYGGAGRLKYLKTELSLRVNDVHTASAVRHHMPLIRNAMVMLLSRQSEEAITSTDGVEKLRESAKQEVIALLESEQNAAEVLDVYFNNLIVQK
ncbi:flagellar basal body-associated FliL family protein [Gilvimarinus sp. SDUM040013]|uniref:Flagellar protein FliL n=1 Tax=Gilvimarinus gilvus TaxID=3058038 RepID=A0ABU4S177_9GAMM|nr:flagellar basal body-associated FliL family protein [Gilvimarinus sp. SDUM040013]MDO3388683.1 flagellar basal body-associated FliL family protein [Gilvimarinus sp. SDUM040013]MDX6849578.1 flagellar basal body-associated FliL family protein [Gilvimarinus sp. SDUM040013]